MDVISAVSICEDESLSRSFLSSIAIIRRALDQYGKEGVALSFNGGKDCTVVLHLIRAALSLSSVRERVEGTAGTFSSTDSQPYQENANISIRTLFEVSRDSSGSKDKDTNSEAIRTLYFENPDSFPEIDLFTKACSERYNLKMEVLREEYRTGIERILSSTQIKAIFLGTRADDPNAKGQEAFAPSSPGWPVFMRVNPILHWTYSDVWKFLLTTKVPYCSLYDRGYTSIGNIHNTLPNEALRISPDSESTTQNDKKDKVQYRPAYLLQDGSLERAGRIKRG